MLGGLSKPPNSPVPTTLNPCSIGVIPKPLYKKITGLDKIITNTVSVFHAGTACNDGQIVTNGGRVFGVTAVGNGIENTIKNVYNAVSKITWDGVYYRTDIGKKALMYLTKI